MNIKIKKIIESCLQEIDLEDEVISKTLSSVDFVEVQKTTSESHGDYYSNIAMKLSKFLRKNPETIAKQIKAII